MLERFTSGAREVVMAARGNALRLGHRWIGCEHLLLALSASDSQAGLILRGQGVTPERVRVEAVRLAGAGRGVSLFDVLDADALAAIGIDLDAVRGKVEAAFGPGALTAAPARRPPGRRWADRLTRRARRVRRQAAVPIAGPVTGAPGPWPAPGEGTGPGRLPAGPGRIPLTPRARKCLMNAALEARAGHSGQVGVEHLGLAVVSMADGAVPAILPALGASGPHLRDEFLRRCRRAS